MAYGVLLFGWQHGVIRMHAQTFWFFGGYLAGRGMGLLHTILLAG